MIGRLGLLPRVSGWFTPSQERGRRSFGRSCPHAAVSFLPRRPGARVQGRLGLAGYAAARGGSEDNDGCAVGTVRVVLRSQSVVREI